MVPRTCPVQLFQGTCGLVPSPYVFIAVIHITCNLESWCLIYVCFRCSSLGMSHGTEPGCAISYCLVLSYLILFSKERDVMQGYRAMSYLVTSGSQSHATTGIRGDCINMIIFCFSVCWSTRSLRKTFITAVSRSVRQWTFPAYRSSRVFQRGRSSAGCRSKICREHQ